jgi:hypothetical protein
MYGLKAIPGVDAVNPGKLIQLLLKLPPELNVENHIVLLEALVIMAILEFNPSHASAGASEVNPGMYTQSLLNTPVGLNVLPHKVLSDARTTNCILFADEVPCKSGSGCCPSRDVRPVIIEHPT